MRIYSLEFMFFVAWAAGLLILSFLVYKILFIYSLCFVLWILLSNLEEAKKCII